MYQLVKVSDLPISKLIHDSKYCYSAEGHGGKTVENWPIHRFFLLYESGKINEATDEFVAWYIDQYKKYAHVDKSKGGMKNGSLDRLYKSLQQRKNREPTFEEAVRERVSQRFQLLESIRSKGYKPNHSTPVMAYSNNNGSYMLFGGHHRVAVLATLDYNKVPDVFVFKNKSSFFLYRCFRKLKKIIKL